MKETFNLSFAVVTSDGGEEEWMFNSLTRFKQTFTNDTHIDSDASVLWCYLGDEKYEFDTFGDLLNEFL